MDNSDFRLYTNSGCPFCQNVLNTLNGYPVEIIDLKNDPVILAGIRQITGQLTATVPILVSFLTGEVLVGSKPEELDQLLAKYKNIKEHEFDR